MTVAPLSLPLGWSLQTVDPDDPSHVDDCYALLRADRVACTGGCRVSRDQVRSFSVATTGGLVISLLLRDQVGRVRSWWCGATESGVPGVFVMVTTDPVDELEADLFAAGWGYLSAWARDVADPRAMDVRTGRPVEDSVGHQRLRRMGLRPVLTLWTMEGEVSAATVAAPLPNGVEVHATDDQAEVHRVLTEGFADDPEFTALSLTDFLALHSWAPGYAPDLWFLVTRSGVGGTGDEVLGAMTLARTSAERGFLWVDELAVLRPYRRQGLASALLARAVTVAQAEGLPGWGLYADSESSDHAPELYRKAGLTVVEAMTRFRGGLRLADAAWS